MRMRRKAARSNRGMHETGITDMQKIMVIPCECHFEPPTRAATLPSEGTRIGISKNLRSATCLAAELLIHFQLGMVMMIDRFGAARCQTSVTCHVPAGNIVPVVVVVVCVCSCGLHGSQDGIVRHRECKI